ncbi:MAG TPA: CDP-alcohol phosphatidyltransferase family protein [Micromonosporaceae bacterium]
MRRGGSRATQLIARVAGRSRGHSATGTYVASPLAPGSVHRDTTSRLGTAAIAVAPVSPAVGPTRLAPQTGPIPLLPGERTTARRVKFAVANGCTIGSLLTGLVAVFLALTGQAPDLRLAAVALLACVVLDGFDGGLARRFNVASPFGAQLDSLADLSSFGVATGIVTYQWLIWQGAGKLSAGVVCALVAVCAAIRLARFNVSPKSGNHFCGVPTTMVAAVLALSILVGPDSVPAWAQVAFVGVYAVAMVTPFPYLKLARIMRLPAWVWVVPAISVMITVAGTFVAVVSLYLVSGPVLWLLQRRRGPRPALAR